MTCTAVASFGGVGVLLAVVGHYSAGVALPLGAIGTVALTVLARPKEPRRPASARRAVVLPAAGVTVAGVVIAAWNAHFSGRHVALDRDPGVYLMAGRWIAEHGNLVVPAGAPWPSNGAGLNLASAGTYTTPGGHVEFQFPHLLPVLIAEAHAIGGDTLMFVVPAVLGAIALWAVYSVACRILRYPAMALAAVVALGVSLPELAVTRDTYSESATQVLLWGGVWLLLRAYEERRVGVGFVAGFVLGATLMTRIDAVVYLVPLPILGAIGWLASDRSVRRSLLRMYLSVAVGALAAGALGTYDLQRRTGGYYSALRHQVVNLYASLLLSALIGVVLVVAWERAPAIAGWFTRTRRQIAVVTAWVVAVGLVVAWALRPAGPKTLLTGPAGAMVSRLQTSEGLAPPPQTYAQNTMIWIAWYIGPIALALAIAGLCIMLAQVIVGRYPMGLVLFAMTAPLTAAYLWNPDISPDQIWAMRRFVPVSIPLLLIAAAVAIEGAAALCSRFASGRVWSRRALIAGSVVLIAFPVGVTIPVRAFRPQAPYLGVVQDTCRFLGPDAAVLFPAGGDYDGATLTQTIRTWCGIPAAQLTGSTSAAQLAGLSRYMRASGRKLWVVGYSLGAIDAYVSGLNPTLVSTATSFRELDETLMRPANSYTQESLNVYAAPVPG